MSDRQTHVAVNGKPIESRHYSLDTSDDGGAVLSCDGPSVIRQGDLIDATVTVGKGEPIKVVVGGRVANISADCNDGTIQRTNITFDEEYD